MGADRIGSAGATNTDGDRRLPDEESAARGSIRDFCTAIFSCDLYLLWRRRTQENHNRLDQ